MFVVVNQAGLYLTQTSREGVSSGTHIPGAWKGAVKPARAPAPSWTLVPRRAARFNTIEQARAAAHCVGGLVERADMAND